MFPDIGYEDLDQPELESLIVDTERYINSRFAKEVK